MGIVMKEQHAQSIKRQLYTIDGVPFRGEPSGYNVKGYPFVITRDGERRRLYTAEHLARRRRAAMEERS